MSTATAIWVSAALAYALFLAWYLPLWRRTSPAETARLLEALRERGYDPAQVEALGRFLAEDRGDAFVMVNLLALAEPHGPAREAMAAYQKRFLGRLLRHAGHPLFIGRAAGAGNLEAWGDAGPGGWHALGLVRYRSRRDLARMVAFSLDGDTRELKHAALARTFAFPVSPWVVSGGPCLVAGLSLALLAAVVQLTAA